MLSNNTKLVVFITNNLLYALILLFRRESGPPPDLVSLIPIRKTRAGLQFTCATPTLGPPTSSNNSASSGGTTVNTSAPSGSYAQQGLSRDVWVCNSDGYVGQVCFR